MTLPDSKVCRGCREVLPFDQFHKAAKYRSGLASQCKSCKAKRQKARGQQAQQLRHRYGIDLPEYEAMLEKQSHVCAICLQPETRRHRYGDEPKKLAVDHDHATGRVRGLLCDSCNNMLGRAKDNPDILRRAADYLETHQG